jgi:hypothetical protein
VMKNVLEEFSVFTLNCEENGFGGIEFSDFLRFPSWIHVSVLRRGDQCVFVLCFGGILGVLPYN